MQFGLLELTIAGPPAKLLLMQTSTVCSYKSIAVENSCFLKSRKNVPISSALVVHLKGFPSSLDLWNSFVMLNSGKFASQELRIAEAHYGPDHYQVGATLVNFGNAYGAIGDPHKQRDLLERSLPIIGNTCAYVAKAFIVWKKAKG